MELERGWPGRIEGDRIVQLAAQTLQAFFTGGGGAREHAEYALADCDLCAPVQLPPSVRLFDAFAPSPLPVFSFVGPYPVVGPAVEVARSAGVGELVYRPALAAVIGAQGAIGGFTLANLWTARELSRAERAGGLGPSKSCDFALSLGPTLVTAEAFTGGGYLRASVNGVERESFQLDRLAHPWGAMREHAARGTTLRPGDLLLAAAPISEGTALAPGDGVEVELEEVGVLASRIAAALS